jgi:hypothetical protein
VPRRIVTAAVLFAVAALFAWEWTAAPRVEASEQVLAQLATVRGELYLGETFEGLPLRTVRPFLYSDCLPGRPHAVACRWLQVESGRVSGSDPRQVAHARSSLRRVA